MGGGGAKGLLPPPPSNYWGGEPGPLAPPLPTPMYQATGIQLFYYMKVLFFAERRNCPLVLNV